MIEVIRLVATDVDGTLLDKSRRISSGTSTAFQQVLARGGVQFALVSSRMGPSLDRIEDALGVPCWKISYDGLMIVSPRPERLTVSSGEGIAVDEAKGLLQRHRMAMAGVYSDSEWFCNADTEWSRREAYNTEIAPIVADGDLADMITGRMKIHKIMFRDTEARISELAEALAKESLHTSRWFSNGPTIIEIVPNFANKSVALQSLVARLDIDPDAVLVFGDGANDVPVFEAFGNSVAVDNAIPQLKRLSRYQTDRCDEDGVAKFLAARLTD